MKTVSPTRHSWRRPGALGERASPKKSGLCARCGLYRKPWRGRRQFVYRLRGESVFYEPGTPMPPCWR